MLQWFHRLMARLTGREAALSRWSIKILGNILTTQHYVAGLAGALVALPEAPQAVGLDSRICRQADIESDWLRHWCRELDTLPTYHRKLWETCFVVQALWEAGALAPGKRGLGFAVGHEPLPSYFAARGAEILATDLDVGSRQAAGWIATDQHGGDADALFFDRLVAREVFDAKVTLRAVDMRRIPADLRGGFDFVWSVCSLEHLGTLDAGIAFVVNAARCLKPGGIAVHTTEFNMAGEGPTVGRGSTVLYQEKHMRRMAEKLAQAGYEMLPFDATPGIRLMDGFIDLPPYPGTKWPLQQQSTPHLVLSVHGFPTTSAGIIVRAPPAP